MTEEKTGGTAPEREAPASIANQASEKAVGAIAIADEPADKKTATDTKSEPSAPAAGAEAGRGSPVAGVPAVAPAESEAPADVAPQAPAADVATQAPAADVASPSSPAQTAPPTPAPQVDPPATAPAAPAAGAATEAQATPPAPDGARPEQARAGSASTLGADDTADAPAAEPQRQGPEPSTMEELLAEQESDIKSFKHGDVVEGNVVRIDKDEILVDIGAKSEGVVSNRELYGRHAESAPQLNVGDTVLVYVLQPESQEGHVVLSLRRAGLERKWRAMQEQFEAGVIIEAPVIDHNKGGLIVDCGIRGFVPISQIVDFPRRPQNDQPRDAAQEIAEKLQPFVGRKLRLKILEVNRKANRLILSEKVALYEERREKRDELFSSLQVGQKVTGTVRSIAPFGVFIDLGGIDGLVHKSELSWNKVNNPEAGYKVGEEVEAEVIDINHERGRISLSIRRLQPDPWHSTVADYKVGDIIDGTVTKLVNFGAFVRVRDGLEGLIHISELSHQRVAHPGDVVHEGQALKLKIISLDSERHRLGLSLKQAEEAPVRVAPEPVAPRPERGDRRPRPERGFSMADAVQEPEGGIDNTLAAAFAQVREQVAASEEAARSDEPAPSRTEAAGATARAEAPARAEAAEAPAPAPARAAAAETPEPSPAVEAPRAKAEAAVEAPQAAEVPAPTAKAETAGEPAPTPATAEAAEAPAKSEATEAPTPTPAKAVTAEAPEPTASAEESEAPAPAPAKPAASAKTEAPAKTGAATKPDASSTSKPETPAKTAPVADEADATGE